MQRRALLLFVTVLCFGMAHAQKTDTIFLYNTDKVVGEIKELKLGLIKLSTNYMSTVYLQWDQIETIRTDKRWMITTNRGTHYEGTLLPEERRDHLRIASPMDTIAIARINIVEMLRLRNKFWARIDGNLNAGLTVQKVNNLQQLSFSGKATYRNRRAWYSVAFSSVQTDQNDGDRSSKQDLSITVERQLVRRWFAGISAGPEQNLQLGTQLRWKANAYLGDYLVKTNHSSIQLLGGFQADQETSVGGIESQYGEVFVGATANSAAYQTPKLNLSFSAYLYDNITVGGRTRFSTNLSVSYEVLKDVTFGVEGYYQVDTEPLDGQGRSEDYRSAITLGYIF